MEQMFWARRENVQCSNEWGTKNTRGTKRTAYMQKKKWYDSNGLQKNVAQINGAQFQLR